MTKQGSYRGNKPKLVEKYRGTGAVTRAWGSWKAQRTLFEVPA